MSFIDDYRRKMEAQIRVDKAPISFFRLGYGLSNNKIQKDLFKKSL
jgi:hypothetical protein